MPNQCCTGSVHPSDTKRAQAPDSPAVQEEALPMKSPEKLMNSEVSVSELCSRQASQASPTTNDTQPGSSKGPVVDHLPSSPLPEDCTSREKLKRHRIEMAGQVWIPATWGQEKLLKDWVSCSSFDSSLVPNGLMSAREALAQMGKIGQVSDSK